MYSFTKSGAVRICTDMKKNPDLKRLIKGAAAKVTVRNVKNDTFMWVTIGSEEEMNAVCAILRLYEEQEVDSKVWTANWKKAKAVREELRAEKKAKAGSETKSDTAPKKKTAAKKKAEPKAEEKSAKKTATKKAEPAKKKTTAKKTTAEKPAKAKTATKKTTKKTVAKKEAA